mmetsp:Transcript_62713/g.72071  ORF Transcript_62713/g.72071 Transcript_62713/m.72071 type:complete len:99 (+) Transcript_62713:74-370(+)
MDNTVKQVIMEVVLQPIMDQEIMGNTATTMDMVLQATTHKKITDQSIHMVNTEAIMEAITEAIMEATMEAITEELVAVVVLLLSEALNFSHYIIINTM